MKSQLALPTGIKKLTNIAVVRLKKAGVRFEIACYKNTVVAWRDKFERDIDNVLQTTQVYNNVSKGIFAKEEDLLKAFGTTDEAKICALILEAGELQVSEKERKQNFENIFRDAVTVLVDKCVNPETNRPYPPGMIERALKEIHFSVDPMKSAKQQALAALPKLQTVFPIKRAEMRFKLTVAPEHVPATLAMLADQRATVETRTTTEIVCTAEPSAYRTCDKHVREATGGTGRLEVVTMAVTEGAGPPRRLTRTRQPRAPHEATPAPSPTPSRASPSPRTETRAAPFPSVSVRPDPPSFLDVEATAEFAGETTGRKSPRRGRGSRCCTLEDPSRRCPRSTPRDAIGSHRWTVSRKDGRWSCGDESGDRWWTRCSSDRTGWDTRRSRTRGGRRSERARAGDAVERRVGREEGVTRRISVVDTDTAVRDETRARTNRGIGSRRSLGAILLRPRFPSGILFLVLVLVLADVDGARQLRLARLVEELVALDVRVESLIDAVFRRQILRDGRVVLASGGAPDVLEETPRVRLRGGIQVLSMGNLGS